MTTYTEEACPFKDGGCSYPHHSHFDPDYEDKYVATQTTHPERDGELQKLASEYVEIFQMHGLLVTNNLSDFVRAALVEVAKHTIAHTAKEVEAAVTRELSRLEGFIGISDLCEQDKDQMLIWANNAKWAVIAPKGEDLQDASERRKDSD